MPAVVARPTLYLVDGTYSVFRSFYAIARLSAPDGTPTNGVFGFVATMRKLVREKAPDHIAVAFDVAGPTHRDEVFAEYKANRPAPPDELVPQFDLAMQAARAMGWPVLTVPGFEADDVLATLARKGREAGLDIVLVTSDKDLYQLVGDGVVVQNPAKEDRVLDAAGVDEVFGVPPRQVGDVLALMGDAADNVPGVPGVGEKTAKSLVRRYGSLDAVLDRAGLFRTAWDTRERALDALAAADDRRLAAALDELAPAARQLAALEAALGGETGADGAARFGAAAELGASTAPKVLKRILGELEKKTQPKVWLSIAENTEAARFSRMLVQLRTDAPVELDLARFRRGPAERDAALALFRRLGFRQFAEAVETETDAAPAPPRSAAPPPSSSPTLFDVAEAAPGPGRSPLAVEIVDSAEALSRMCDELRGGGTVSIATVTDRPGRSGRLVGLAASLSAAGGWYVPVAHRGAARQIPWGAAHGPLAALLGDATVSKAGTRLNEDRAALRGAGIALDGLAFDPLLAARLLDPERSSAPRLAGLCERWLGETVFEEGDGDGGPVDTRAVDVVARRAVHETVLCGRLVEPLREQLRRDDLLELFETTEMPLLPVLEDMEARGVRVDAALLSEMSARMELQLAALETEIHGLAGRPFNVNSPQQLRTILFDELALQPTRRTQKTRALSTSQEVLEALAEVHPLPARVLEFRELAKLKGTYLDALPKLIDPADGRVHTHFNQIGAATGRLSSTDPNLQNIPVRTAAGRMIRTAFVPEPGWTFLSADYSQMELRLLAHLADDRGLIEVFERGLDVHRATAALVAGVPLDEVTPQLRAAAKAVNFGIVYGMSEYRLARDQGMTVEQARAFIAAYFERYPRIRSYIADTERQVQETGEVRTLYGRVRRFPDLVAGSGASRLTRPMRDTLLRQAVNATVQGTGADIVKRAMIVLDARLRAGGFRSRLLLQVHDELLLEAPPEELEKLGTLVPEVMENAAHLSVPLKVDARTADSWAEAH